jgi:hypothetical protein
MFPQRRQLSVSMPMRRPVTGTSTLPQAPRTMVPKEYPERFKHLKQQIQQDEATKLYPRLALFKALSGFKDKHKPRERSEDRICETRRDFLDSFAYLCDIQKGGSTVTAAALQKLPLSNILWLAANEGVRDDVLVYAMDILARLKTATLQSQSTLRNSIFRLAVKRCGPRIQFYKDEVQKYARNCRMALRKKDRDDIGL